MFHPIAETHHRFESIPNIQSNEEESEIRVQPQGATTWKPLPLGTIEHEPSKIVFESQRTPFDAELPSLVQDKYIDRCHGPYALYSLIHLGRDDIYDITHTIERHANKLGRCAPKVVRAPIYGQLSTASFLQVTLIDRLMNVDFCSNHKSVRDLFDYHVSLVDGGKKDVASGRFIVAAHPDWEIQGLLIVDFDCQPTERGKIGIMRVDVASLPLFLRRLEESNRNWTLLKAIELDTKWSAPIVGYDGSRWNYYGYEYHKEKWLKGNYGISQRAV